LVRERGVRKVGGGDVKVVIMWEGWGRRRRERGEFVVVFSGGGESVPLVIFTGFTFKGIPRFRGRRCAR
jgi:hypothetical protein